MTFYELFIISLKTPFGEQCPIIKSVLNTLYKNGCYVHDVKYYGNSRLPYRVRYHDAYHYDGW